MDTTELLGFVLGVLSVVLVIRRTIWNYLPGALSALVYVYIFLQAGLYANSLFQVYFFLAQLYGVWRWFQARGDDGLIRPSLLTARGRGLAVLVSALLTAVIAFAIARLPGAEFTLADAAIAGGSVVAQMLHVYRKSEGWIAWVAVNAFAVPVFWMAGLGLTAVLYAIFLVLAVMGWRAWEAVRASEPATA